MSVRIGAGLSTELDPLAAAFEAAQEAGRGLEGAEAELVLVFAAGAHLAAPEPSTPPAPQPTSTEGDS